MTVAKFLGSGRVRIFYDVTDNKSLPFSRRYHCKEVRYKIALDQK